MGDGGEGIAPAFELGGMEGHFAAQKGLETGLEGGQQRLLRHVIVDRAVDRPGMDRDQGGRR